MVFQDRLFLKARVWTFFHIPLNFGKVMARSMDRIDRAGAQAPAPFMLYDERSLFHADVYIEVDRDVPEARMQRLSGTFLSRVYVGPFSYAEKWVRNMKRFARSRGKNPKKIYFCYTTCPACAKVYGRNYVVLLVPI